MWAWETSCASAPSTVHGSSCHAPTAWATLTVGAGDMELHVGGLWVGLGAGDISGSVHGDARIVAGASNIDLNTLSWPIEVVAGAGNVTLCFDRAPHGQINVTAGIGTVYVDLPDGSLVDADVPRCAHNAFGSSRNAPTRVELSAGLGTIRLDWSHLAGASPHPGLDATD